MVRPEDHKTICFDLDGTLCTNTAGDYEAAEPFPWAVERVNALARAGHRIVIFTARGTATGIDWERVTRAQLERWGVSYDELRFGKPSADIYVDDRAVQTLAWRWGEAAGVPGFASTVSAGGDRVPGLPPPHLMALVEVGRTFAGKPFRVERHAARLRYMALAAGAHRLPAELEIADAALEALARADAGSEDLSFTISLSSLGHAAFADALELALPAGLHVACRPVRHAAAGLRPLISDHAPAGSVVVDAAIAADGLSAAWPLLVDEHGHATDALGGQLGVVSGRSLVLGRPSGPPTVAGSRLDELAAHLGLEVRERPLGLDELRAADEAFVVGMPFCVLPLGSLDGDPLWGPAPGAVARSLLEAWSRDVGLDIASQTASFIEAGTALDAPRERAVG